jgi:hypothetical protein
MLLKLFEFIETVTAASIAGEPRSRDHVGWRYVLRVSALSLTTPHVAGDASSRN